MPMTNYQAYILRLWHAREAGAPAYRASLETITNGTRQRFADIEELIIFLRTECEPSPSAPDELDLDTLP
jgi:hypothetical protein